MAFRTMLVILAVCASVSSADAQVCSNPGGVVYNKNPVKFAPNPTRTKGFQIGLPDNPRALLDVRPSCLPLPIRYNNPGALQTPKSGPWNGQIDRDKKGHAVFDTVESGVAAWLTWVELRIRNGTNTPYKLMSMYAPPTDCVGTVDKLSNGECPAGFPLNDTKGYAKRIAETFGTDLYSKLNLSLDSCKSREGLKTFLSEILLVENGRIFCDGRCGIEKDVFNGAANRTSGKSLNCM